MPTSGAPSLRHQGAWLQASWPRSRSGAVVPAFRAWGQTLGLRPATSRRIPARRKIEPQSRIFTIGRQPIIVR